MLDHLLPLLRLLSDGEFHSGASLGEALGVSRSAIWKSIKKIPDLGLIVHSVKGKGYRLQQRLELLDEGMLSDAIKRLQVKSVVKFELLNTVGSTNAFVLKQIQQGDLDLTKGKILICLAEQQSQGKGRRGRTWISPFGRNMYLSIGREFEAGVQGLEGLSLVIGLALIRALVECGANGLGVKWPNDVLWQNQKVAGILLEMTGDLTGACQVVIGVGLNIQVEEAAMSQVDQPWTDLASIISELPSRNQIIGCVISHIILAVDEFERKGFASFMREWQEFDLLAENPVVLHKTLRAKKASCISGIACGVTTNGSLLLQTADGLQSYNGGEVSLKAN